MIFFVILINKNLKQNLQDFFPEKSNIRTQADQQMRNSREEKKKKVLVYPRCGK